MSVTVTTFSCEVSNTTAEHELPETKELPQKNTFIHFEVDESSDSEVDGCQIERLPRKGPTCPELVMRRAFRTKTALRRRQQEKLALHLAGECKPCCFFAFKADGCRHGDDCEYCHLCTRRDIRRWKKARRNISNVGGQAQTGSGSATTASNSGDECPQED